MCRRNGSRCVLLGSDPLAWSPFEPLPPHPALLRSFPYFEKAVRAAAEGDVERARAELLSVESDAIRLWYIEHAQVAGSCRSRVLGRSVAEYRGDVDTLAYPRAADVAAILAADGHRCRYCQRPVVHRDLLRALQGIVGKTALPMGPTNLALHGAVIAHRAVVDHVVPRKRGGRTERANLVTACYPCNFGKAHYALDELGMAPPRPAVRDAWDALQSLVPALRSQARQRERERRGGIVLA